MDQFGLVECENRCYALLVPVATSRKLSDNNALAQTRVMPAIRNSCRVIGTYRFPASIERRTLRLSGHGAGRARRPQELNSTTCKLTHDLRGLDNISIIHRLNGKSSPMIRNEIGGDSFSRKLPDSEVTLELEMNPWRRRDAYLKRTASTCAGPTFPPRKARLLRIGATEHRDRYPANAENHLIASNISMNCPLLATNLSCFTEIRICRILNCMISRTQNTRYRMHNQHQ